jgi:hypothetical protein
MRPVAVDFACNDPDNGSFAGKAGVASVFGNDLELDPFGGVAFTEGTGWIRIHRRKFRCRGSRHWVGNWCWNRYFFARSEYRRLIRTLAEHGWRCTGGLARWSDAYDALAGRALLSQEKANG